RREVLCAGGAAAFSSVVAALLGGSERARAQALAVPVPEVDYLAVRVVTDSFQLAIAPNMKVGAVEVQRFGMPPAGESLLEGVGLSWFPDALSADAPVVTVTAGGFEHELSMCLIAARRGLVVRTSCRHRGVGSAGTGAMGISGVRAVHAVMGRFHLAPHKEAYV